MSAQKKVKKKKRKKNRFYPVTNCDSVSKELVIKVQTSDPDDGLLFQTKKKKKSRTKLILEQHLASGDWFEEKDEDFDLSEIQVIII
jgi:hypothetical protein